MKVVALKKHWDGTMLNIIRTGLLLERARKRAASSKISSDDEQSKIRRTIIEGHVWFYARKNFQHLNFSKPWKSSLINDENLLAILSGGDVVAQELKQHYSCLTALYNIERVYLLTIENQDDRELSQEREVYPIVFSELLTYILEAKTSNDKLIVFRLADPVSRNSD